MFTFILKGKRFFRNVKIKFKFASERIFLFDIEILFDFHKQFSNEYPRFLNKVMWKFDLWEFDSIFIGKLTLYRFLR